MPIEISSEAMMNSKGGSGGAIAAGCFVEDVGKMMGDGFFTQSQFPGYLAVGQSSHDEPQHLNFSCGQPGRINR